MRRRKRTSKSCLILVAGGRGSVDGLASTLMGYLAKMKFNLDSGVVLPASPPAQPKMQEDQPRREPEK